MAEDWSSLPRDILSNIAMKLGNIEDFVYFSVVCQWWNDIWSSVKNDWRPIPAVPWLFLAENTKDNPDCFRKIFNLGNNKCYKLSLPETFGKRCWGSAYGWIAMVGRDFDVKLFNPITKAQICFPSLKTHPELSRYDEKYYKSREEYISWCMTRLSKLIVLDLSKRGGYHEFVIVILSNMRQSAAFARHGDQSWTPIFIKKTEEVGSIRTYGIYDVISMDDYAYAMHDDGSMVYFNFNETPSLGHNDGSIVCLNLYETLSSKLVKPVYYSPPLDEKILEELRWGCEQKYLVRSGNNLLMVLRYKDDIMDADGKGYDCDIVYRTEYFRVFKLDPKDKSWSEIEDLGEVAYFVGSGSSMCVSTTEAKYLQRSSIYFTDDEDNEWVQVTDGGGHDMGVSNLISEEIWQFYQGHDTRSSFNPPIWFIPTF